MKTANKIICVLSSLGLLASLVALILLAVSDGPFLPEFTIESLTAHPLVWLVISGGIFFSAIAPLLGKSKEE